MPSSAAHTVTRPRPLGEPEERVEISFRRSTTELFVGAAVAALISLLIQRAASYLKIGIPSFAPEALAALGTGLVLTAMFCWLLLVRRRPSHWLGVCGTWVALSTFNSLAVVLPLQATRYFYDGSSGDNAFRLQYITRLTSTAIPTDMNYADIAPYYPAGWFWLGGRFANLIGWEGWAAYKPFALMSVAVATVVAYTLWSMVVRRRVALLATILTATTGMLTQAIAEPYAWLISAWLAPTMVLAWQALRGVRPRWTLLWVGGYLGIAAITYTLYFAFAVMVVVMLAIVIGAGHIHRGARVDATVGRMFVRLLPIGLVSLILALVFWLPFLISMLNAGSPHGAATRFLFRSGALLPLPMTQPTAMGVLCLVGTVWLVVRCRRSEIAAALLVISAAVYCWYALSTLALAADNTLLSFRMNPVLWLILGLAGVFGLLEVVTVLQAKMPQYAQTIGTAACVLGLLGAIALNQAGIGGAMDVLVAKANKDYYPSGGSALGDHDRSRPDVWLADEIATIAELTGRAPQDNVLLSTDGRLLSFEPYWGFQDDTPHYANPLGRFDERNAEIKQWATASRSDELIRMLSQSEFRTPNVFVLKKPEKSSKQDEQDKLSYLLKKDAFPRLPNVESEQVYFDSAVFDSPAFVRRDVGPYAIIALR